MENKLRWRHAKDVGYCVLVLVIYGHRPSHVNQHSCNEVTNNRNGLFGFCGFIDEIVNYPSLDLGFSIFKCRVSTPSNYDQFNYHSYSSANVPSLS